MKPGRALALALGLGAGLGSITAAHAVSLVHTNDILGEIEPCGCRTNPQGGMTRKANFMKKLADSDLLQLDAGDLLFPTDKLPPLLEKQSSLQATYLLRTMDSTGHDAVVPGEKDYALGFAVFEKLRKGSKIKFLAANLSKRGGAKYLEPWAIFKKKRKDGSEIKIGVIGLVGEALRWPHELKASSAIAAAKREVAILRGKKLDFIVALTHQGLDQDKALAKAVPGIDFIVGGHTQSFLQQPLKIGSTWIFQSSFRNQYVGVIPLESKPFAPDSYQLVGLDAGYDSPAEAPSWIDDRVKEFKTAVAELNSREEEAEFAHSRARQAADGKAEAGHSKFQTFPRCAECHLKQFEFWRKTQHFDALSPLLEKEQARNLECLGCHTVGLGDPQGFKSVNRLAEFRKPAASGASAGTPSSGIPSDDGETDFFTTEQYGAYLKEVRKAKDFDSKIKFHPSYPEPMPVRQSLNLMARAWSPVQCENCHKAGYDHPFAGAFTKKVEKTTCLGCHTQLQVPSWYGKDNQPDFKVIDAKFLSVTCPAGDPTESAE